MKKTIIAFTLGAVACKGSAGGFTTTVEAIGLNTTGSDSVRIGFTEAEIAAFTEADFQAIERAQMIRK